MQRQKDKPWNHKIPVRDTRLNSCSRRASVSWMRSNILPRGNSSPAHLTAGRGVPVWDTLLDVQEEMWIPQHLVWDRLGEKPKTGKGKDITGLERNKGEKLEGKEA